jgi:hypothetical protein
VQTGTLPARLSLTLRVLHYLRFGHLYKQPAWKQPSLLRTDLGLDLLSRNPAQQIHRVIDILYQRAPSTMGAPAPSTSSAPSPPSELQLDEKWDKFIDLSLRRVVYGTLAGSLAALTILSKGLHAHQQPCLLSSANAAGLT